MKNKNNKKLEKAEKKAEKQLEKAQRKEVKKAKKAVKKSYRRDVLTRTMGMNPYKNQQQAYREVKAYDAIDSQYIKCVFDPRNNLPTRIPSIFPAPTALFKYTQINDITVTATSPSARSFVVVCPWNLTVGGGSAGSAPSFLNYSVGQAAVPVTEFQVRIAHPMQGYMGEMNDATKRYVSYRPVACAAEISCTTNVTNIQGTITSACLLGPNGGNNVYAPGWVPTSTQLLQHPFGYDRAVVDITESNPMRTTYFPIDPMDQVFHTSVDPSDDASYRSPIVFVFENISTNITFRIKTTTVIEYIPTLNFRQWTDTAFPADKPRSIEVVRSLVSANPVAAVSGKMDQAVSSAPPTVNSGDGFLGWMRRAIKGVGVITDHIGGVPGLIGRAVREAFD